MTTMPLREMMATVPRRWTLELSPVSGVLRFLDDLSLSLSLVFVFVPDLIVGVVTFGELELFAVFVTVQLLPLFDTFLL